jgi:L-2,4-diaminobutyrate decarboxylase
MTLKDDSRTVAQALEDYDRKGLAREGIALRQPPSSQLIQSMDLQRFATEGGLTGDALRTFVEAYLDGTIKLRDPRVMGHQTAHTNDAAALGCFIDGYASNPMAINEMGPAANAIEQFYLDWMLQKIGWSVDRSQTGHPGGVLTHGGSLANLTALCAARSAADPDAWMSGPSRDLVVLAPPASHYSLARAVGILGLGENAIVDIPVDECGRIIPSELAVQIETQRAAGKVIMAVIANACQTAAGLFDPLRDIADVCRKAGTWFHVDGAHGAAASLSPDLAHLVDGIDLADSLIWDSHKMLRTPCLCAAVLVRDHRHLDAAFNQEASYIFHEKENPGFDFLGRTVECTKSALALKAFMALAYEGEAGLCGYVEALVARTLEAARLVANQPDFEIAVQPEFNILCLRLTKGQQTCSLELRKRLLARGRYYTTYVEFLGQSWIRLTLMQAETNMDDIRGLLDEIRLVARQEA